VLPLRACPRPARPDLGAIRSPTFERRASFSRSRARRNMSESEFLFFPIILLGADERSASLLCLKRFSPSR
jgi:hypothetical protein